MKVEGQIRGRALCARFPAGRIALHLERGDKMYAELSASASNFRIRHPGVSVTREAVCAAVHVILNVKSTRPDNNCKNDEKGVSQRLPIPTMSTEAVGSCHSFASICLSRVFTYHACICITGLTRDARFSLFLSFSASNARHSVRHPNLHENLYERP